MSDIPKNEIIYWQLNERVILGSTVTVFKKKRNRVLTNEVQFTWWSACQACTA